MESYDDFIFEIRAKYNEVWGLAQEKVEIEEMTMWSLVGSGSGLVLAAVEFFTRDLGYIEAVKNEETWEKIEEFAVKHCFDCSGVADAKAEFQRVTDQLSTGTVDSLTKIIGGLEDWASPETNAAENFKRNFVASLVTVRDQQMMEFGRAEIYLDVVTYMVEYHRAALRDALEQLKTGLERYEPFILVNIMGFHWGLMGAGLVVGPMRGAIATAADMFVTGPLMELSGSAGKGTAGMFELFRQGMDAMTRMGHDTSDDVADRFHGFRMAIPIADMTFPKPSIYDENGE